MSAVKRSWAIFLQTNGSKSGHSSKRGHAAEPINFIGSYDDTALFGFFEFFSVESELKSLPFLLWPLDELLLLLLCKNPV